MPPRTLQDVQNEVAGFEAALASNDEGQMAAAIGRADSLLKSAGAVGNLVTGGLRARISQLRGLLASACVGARSSG